MTTNGKDQKYGNLSVDNVLTVGKRIVTSKLVSGQVDASSVLLSTGDGKVVEMIGPDASDESWVLALPGNPGLNGQVLSTDGLGNTEWVTVSGGGGTSGRNNIVYGKVEFSNEPVGTVLPIVDPITSSPLIIADGTVIQDITASDSLLVPSMAASGFNFNLGGATLDSIRGSDIQIGFVRSVRTMKPINVAVDSPLTVEVITDTITSGSVIFKIFV